MKKILLVAAILWTTIAPAMAAEITLGGSGTITMGGSGSLAVSAAAPPPSYGADFLTGGTPTGDAGTSYADRAFDGLYGPNYAQNGGAAPWWLKYDLGSGVTKTAAKYDFTVGSSYKPSAWTLAGSNDNTNWTDLDSQSGISWTSWETKSFEISNTTAYRYYRWTMTAPNNWLMVVELDAMELE